MDTATKPQIGDIRVFFKNAISSRPGELHTFTDLGEAVAFANNFDNWPYNNTSVQMSRIIDEPDSFRKNREELNRRKPYPWPGDIPAPEIGTWVESLDYRTGEKREGNR